MTQRSVGKRGKKEEKKKIRCLSNKKRRKKERIGQRGENADVKIIAFH